MRHVSTTSFRLSSDQQLPFHTGYEPRAIDLVDLAPFERITSVEAQSVVCCNQSSPWPLYTRHLLDTSPSALA
jgi:hypothetical protein